MKILADANIEPQIAENLRRQGHDVLSVQDWRPSASDEEVLEMAASEERVVLTYDLGFGEMAVRRGILHSGIIILRLKSLPLKARSRRTLDLLQGLSHPPAGTLCVIEPARSRKHRTSRD